MNTKRTKIFSLGPLLKLAAPVTAAYVGQLSMGLVDIMVVGRLGAANLAGVALGNAMFYLCMIIGFGLLTGMDYLAAHAYGARDLARCRKIFIHALILAAGLSLPLGIAPYYLSYFLQIFGATPDVVSEAAPFLRMLSLSMPPLLIYMACRQYLQALGSARAAMILLIVANIINLGANFAFVLGWWGFPAMGTAGSAVATLMSRVFMAMVMLLVVAAHDRKLLAFLGRQNFKLETSLFREILKLGTPASIQMLMEVGAFSGSTILVARLGAADLAAHQIVLQIASTTFMVPLGISSATAVLVGQNIGAKDPQEAARCGWTGFALGAGFMALSGVGLYAAADFILGFFTKDASVLQASHAILITAAIFQIADGLQVVGTGALRGIADTKTAMFANFAGHWCFGIPLGIYLCFYCGQGLSGLWIGLATGLAVVAAALLFFWAKNARHLTKGRIPSS